MDKEQIQDQELDQVAGGITLYSKVSCPKCGERFIASGARGTLRTVNDGCWHTKHYLKCPTCSYEWEQ